MHVRAHTHTHAQLIDDATALSSWALSFPHPPAYVSTCSSVCLSFLPPCLHPATPPPPSFFPHPPLLWFIPSSVSRWPELCHCASSQWSQPHSDSHTRTHTLSCTLQNSSPQKIFQNAFKKPTSLVFTHMYTQTRPRDCVCFCRWQQLFEFDVTGIIEEPKINFCWMNCLISL